MLSIFEYRCLEQIVLGKETRLAIVGDDQTKFDKCSREAVMLLKLLDIDDMFPKVPSSKKVNEIWDHLKNLHETFDKSRAFFLMNMFSIMMDEMMSLQEHLTKIKEIHDQLEAVGRKMEEEDMVVITLKSLPRSYEHLLRCSTLRPLMLT